MPIISFNLSGDKGRPSKKLKFSAKVLLLICFKTHFLIVFFSVISAYIYSDV